MLKKMLSALVLLATLCSPATATTLNATPATIVANISAAQSGDTVVLAPGDYGLITIGARVWQPPVTLDARAATYTLTLDRTAGLRLLAGTTAHANVPASTRGFGIWLKAAQRIGIENPTLIDNRINVFFDSAKNSYVHGAKCTGQRSDCVDVFSSDGIDVGYTSCTVPGAGVGQHPDCVQAAQRFGKPTRNVKVHHTYAKGDFQCVNAFSHNRPTGNDGPFRGLTFTDNVCIGLYPQGITAANVIGGTFTDNTAYTMKGARYVTRFQLYGCTSCTVARNVVGDRPGALPVKPEPLPFAVPAVAPALLKMIGF